MVKFTTGNCFTGFDLYYLTYFYYLFPICNWYVGYYIYFPIFIIWLNANIKYCPHLEKIKINYCAMCIETVDLIISLKENWVIVLLKNRGEAFYLSDSQICIITTLTVFQHLPLEFSVDLTTYQILFLRDLTWLYLLSYIFKKGLFTCWWILVLLVVFQPLLWS